MDRTVIRKILDTSTRDLLGDKAADARQRRGERSRHSPQAAAHGRLSSPAPAAARAASISLDALPPEPATGATHGESFEQTLDVDSIDGPIDVLDDDALGSVEALHEAETDIGIATWLDPETGEPAEGSCPPHLDEQ